MTILVGANAFFIATLVKKIEDSSEATIRLSSKVEELAKSVDDQKKQTEKFSQVYLEVAILKRKFEGNVRRPGNGAYMEEADE